MANAIIPNQGETRILNLLFKGSNEYKLDLYESNTTINETITNGLLSFVTGGGYSGAHVIPAADWTVSGTLASAPSHEFTFTGAKTIYGVALLDNTNNNLISVMSFDTPQVIGASGGSLIITPTFTLLEEA